ncbi:MAG TPA: S8 family serine peptidase [Kofleriaceae bacterium]|nr:S8 family serine peptidase [Kofleriaceae bacterium]
MSDDTAAPDGDEVISQAVCTTGRYRCHARVVTGTSARRIASRAAAAPTPAGFGPAELQSAYRIDPKTIATSTPPTIAIIDAYGYTALEADLGVYRSQYGLPPCTIANGCLKIVNQLGQTTNLPPNPPADDDWRVETALDIDMASAACPKCKLLVVQANDNIGDGLETSQATAVTLGAAVISNSWGGPEDPQQPAATSGIEAFFDHPGVAIFVAAGDAGYNDQLGDQLSPKQPVGPDYPGTSAHTIAVGATRLARAPSTARGWTETTWAPTAGMPDRGAGGSACSNSIPKPVYQAASPCAFKATTDIAAVGDPATGVAVYTSAISGGWTVIGGTSASAPFVAGIFAGAGLGPTASGAFLAANAAKLNDVTTGTNGTCGTQTLLCNAAAGWDGPTGFGTPNASAFIAGATGSGSGSGSGGRTDTTGGDQSVSGGCSTAGSGAGVLLGVALLGLRRRRRA